MLVPASVFLRRLRNYLDSVIGDEQNTFALASEEQDPCRRDTPLVCSHSGEVSSHTAPKAPPSLKTPPLLALCAPGHRLAEAMSIFH